MINNILLPILFILLSGGVYFGLTDPLITGGDSVVFGSDKQGITQLQKEKEALNTALEDAKNLEARASELQRKVDSISQADIQRLDDFLPDSIDNMQLVVDLNNIAGRSNMRLGRVTLAETETKDVASSDNLVKRPVVETTSVAFTVTGSYAELKAFVQDIASSLRITDITQLSFNSGAESVVGGEYTYEIAVETYWLK